MAQLSTEARNAACNAVVDLLDAGKLQLFTASYATLLVEFALSNPAFGDAASGLATAAAIADGTAVASGNAESYRLINLSDATVIQSSEAAAVSESGGGGEIVLNQASTAITSGQTVTVSALTWNQPAGA